MFKKIFLSFVMVFFVLLFVVKVAYTQELNNNDATINGIGLADNVDEQLKALQQLEGIITPEMLQVSLGAWSNAYGSLQPILEVAFTNKALQSIMPFFIRPMMASITLFFDPLVAMVMGERPTNIDAYELQRLINRSPDIQIIDVRTPAEYEQLHIPGAINIPIQQLNRELESGIISKAKEPTVCYCVSGFNGYVASLLTVIHGYPNVYNLELGIIGGWLEEGLPLEGTFDEGDEVIIRGGC